MARYDFKALKRDIPIEKVMVWLKLKFHKDENGWRAHCPVCDSAERSLSLNPVRNVFTCHKSGENGSILDLVMHVEKIDLQGAGKWLTEHSTRKVEQPTPVPQATKATVPQKQEKGTDVDTSQPLSKIAATLVFHHPKVQDLGLTPQDAERMGIGYKPRGLYKALVVAPIRLSDGHDVCYFPVGEGHKFPKTLLWPGTNVIPLDRKRRA